MFPYVMARLSPGVRMRIRQELANSHQTGDELIEELLLEALRSRATKADVLTTMEQRWR